MRCSNKIEMCDRNGNYFYYVVKDMRLYKKMGKPSKQNKKIQINEDISIKLLMQSGIPSRGKIKKYYHDTDGMSVEYI